MVEPYNPSNSREEFQSYLYSRLHNEMLPHNWNSVLNRIKKLVEVSKNTINAELEIHVGRIKSKFYSGVSEHWFETQLQKMEKFTKWDKFDKDWIRMEELVYEGDVRMRRNPGGEGIFMKKSIIDSIDIPLKDSNYDIRFILKSENEAHISFGIPVFYRFKERKSMEYKGFLYSFTKIWQGETLQKVEQCKTRYEIEIECTDLACDASYLATSMILKCEDIVGKKESDRKRKIYDSMKEDLSPNKKISSSEKLIEGIKELHGLMIQHQTINRNILACSAQFN